MAMTFDALPAFAKEFHRLSRKYRSLPRDLEEFKRVLQIQPLGNSKHFNVITKVEGVAILKARLFCRYLKGSSLRIIYAYHQKRAAIEFIEIYFKGDIENEDRERIEEYLKRLGAVAHFI
ncbi:MAG: hypothetical protein HYV03_03135 [Deltaproteobacteria bacterium]|nr:hypothetical protein [Deltaproteobacteria bacterium]